MYYTERKPKNKNGGGLGMKVHLLHILFSNIQLLASTWSLKIETESPIIIGTQDTKISIISLGIYL